MSDHEPHTDSHVRSSPAGHLVWSAESDRMDQASWYEKQIRGWGRDKRQA